MCYSGYVLENDSCKESFAEPSVGMLDGFKRVNGHTYQLKANEFWAGYGDLKFHLTDRTPMGSHYSSDLLTLLGHKFGSFRFPMKRSKIQSWCANSRIR